MDEMFMHNQMSDKMNAFIYQKVFEVAQKSGIGPETETAEEFYAEVAKDKKTLKAIAEVAAPLVSAETGLPLFVSKKLVKMVVARSAKDASKTIKRVAKKEEANNPQMQSALAESRRKKMISEAVQKAIDKHLI